MNKKTYDEQVDFIESLMRRFITDCRNAHCKSGHRDDTVNLYSGVQEHRKHDILRLRRELQELSRYFHHDRHYLKLEPTP